MRKGSFIQLEHYAKIVERIEARVTATRSNIKVIDAYLHRQLNVCVSEEYVSDYYAIIDIETGRLDGLKETLKVLQAELLKYKANQL